MIMIDKNKMEKEIYYIHHVRYTQVAIIFIYSETCLNRTSLGPGFVFGIDRCSFYAWFWFIQGL